VVAINATRRDRGHFVDDETPRLAAPEADFAELGFGRHLQAANEQEAPELAPHDQTFPQPPRFLPELREDLAAGLSNRRLCVLLGTTELRRRYSRSRLRQTWITPLARYRRN
jgi:ABC-2 type transport system permease protein/lipopolysaccharide transport system permease protein